jgi:hypothetical protein
MIREFAIEPELLSEFNVAWQAMEQFGICNGRMISEYPKGWLRMVYDETAKCDDVARKKLEVRLGNLRQKVVRFRRNREYAPDRTWRENVHAEHGEDAFNAILQRDNTENHGQVLLESDLHVNHSLWQVRTQTRVPRTPESLAETLGPLGKISKELLFVDPHFTNEARFSRVLVASLNACGVTPGSHRRIELHTSSMPNRVTLEQNVKQHVVPHIPRGVDVKFVLWEERDPGEKFHARYFWTERGGIRFDVGLDEGNLGQTTDVSLLEDGLYRERWNDFQGEKPAYDKIDEFTITGTG